MATYKTKHPYPVDRLGTLHRAMIYNAACGTCSYTDSTDSAYDYADAAAWLRAEGWKQTKSHGWICPDCAARRARRKAAAQENANVN